ncbi:MAG: ribonuclease P protein component [Ruminococcaceae bacterium]|nr:ribonuclease P protein component [Oscillospiraceae bacterium]
MSKPITLNQNSDFRRAYGRGKSFASSALVTYVVKNRVGYCRYGITTGKKIGNAVERNRARRVIRAAFSQLAPEISGSFDIVFVARSKTKFVKSTAVVKAMREHLCSAGVISRNEKHID